QPGDILAVYENIWSEDPKGEFTLSIEDDVTNLSIKGSENPYVAPESTVSCKFWGLGADGTVGANKNSVKIIGDHTGKYVQAYFQYDSKKSGGVTISHLRFGDEPIRSTYYVKQADFVACHKAPYINRYRIVEDIKKGGTFLLNCNWTDEEMDEKLPGHVKKYIAENDINFYTCDAIKIAGELGLKTRTNTVLQAAFFKLANIIPVDDVVGYMKDAIRNTYARKGQNIVDMNCAAVDAGLAHVHKVEVPAYWKDADPTETPVLAEGRDKKHTDYINNILKPTNSMNGDNIPVSAFIGLENGVVPAGTSAFEKRGIAIEIPKWDASKCMQCNWCSYICPHAVIRPFVLDKNEVADYEGDVIPLNFDNSRYFTIGISALDCTSCGSCVEVCPARQKALEIVPAFDTEEKAQKEFDYLVKNIKNKKDIGSTESITRTQFIKPLLEFSGACPGCGETPYAKLVTQLFGERMMIANATGCSSIWGLSAPAAPYTVTDEGKGPAWANSLFEDNAEFGYGMAIAMKTRREETKHVVQRLASKEEFKQEALEWIIHMNDSNLAGIAGDKLLEVCKGSDDEDAIFVVENADTLPKPSIWMFGGDGWAYDIGYGGLDHVLASGENVNVLVFDTEVYSNTGGQSSKSTPIGAVAQFASAGKAVMKKNLAQLAMTYGYVYVAQVAMGANPAQTLKALKEAESYEGPSIVICYAPCINHGVKAGMNKAMVEMKRAVRAGYWNLFRYNPSLIAEKKNPLSIDSAPPTESYRDFLRGEVRYNSLELKNPERADKLFTDAEKTAMERYKKLLRQKKNFENQ
ncbi:MAG: pyruvate:ferredoxin (flavodoxin) oxidoreductase, partial [Firmicutes bacterium]|nr:pyruvate:ferredoxin (flavodoxin) oxidoreductase [Bacillota bacterium]